MDILFISGFVLRSMYTFLEHYYGDADYEHCSLQSLACMYYTFCSVSAFFYIVGPYSGA